MPGKNLDDGLRIIDRDADTLSMASVVSKIKNFILYVHQKDLFDDIELDDICIIGSPELPPGMSPMKPDHLPAFYDDVVVSPGKKRRGTTSAVAG